MKVGELNDENKNDLAVLKMRGSLFKDKFFKKNDSDTLPKYFEVNFKSTFHAGQSDSYFRNAF